MTAVAWATRAAPVKSRDEFRTEYAGLTRADLAVQLLVAETPDEVDAVAHLSLALFDVAGCSVSFTEHCADWVALNQLVGKVRTRIAGPTAHQRRMAERFNAFNEAGRAVRSRERRADFLAKAHLEPVEYRPIHSAPTSRSPR